MLGDQNTVAFKQIVRAAKKPRPSRKAYQLHSILLDEAGRIRALPRRQQKRIRRGIEIVVIPDLLSRRPYGSSL